MNFSLVWNIALRYLKGKRSGNAVPILSAISMMAIAVATAAMIILFSVFNGFEGLVKDLYKSFYPAIKITAAKGKFFDYDDKIQQLVAQQNGVSQYTAVLEDNVLLNSYDEQIVASIKGVSNNYFDINNIKPYITAGRDSVSTAPLPTAVLGQYIAAQLGVDVENVFSQLIMYYPNAETNSFALDPLSSFQSATLKPDGIFRIQDDFDSKYIIIPFATAAHLLNVNNQASSLDIALAKGAREQKVKQELQGKLGAGYKVETRYEQNRMLFMVMNVEKWAVYAILSLVLLIASFNMTGGLSLLALEKKQDMGILKAMGATKSVIAGIFITEGIIWAMLGCLGGLLLGSIICFLQLQFGLVKLAGSFLIEAYPVRMLWSDYLLIIATVIVIAVLASVTPAIKASRQKDRLL